LPENDERDGCRGGRDGRHEIDPSRSRSVPSNDLQVWRGRLAAHTRVDALKGSLDIDISQIGTGRFIEPLDEGAVTRIRSEPAANPACFLG
jgi:hypothetical protein